MEKIEHKMVAVNGIDMHIAELGQGPTILLIHGFPELWYSWRHQIVYLAERGYRAVAPDLRGYGDTTGAPINDVSKFSILHLVGDLVALLEAIAPNEDKVFVVAHDWGALIAWHLCLFRPDKVKALVNLSVHFFPRNPKMNPVEGMKALYGEDHYVWRFQHGALNSPCTRDSGCGGGRIFTKEFIIHHICIRKKISPIQGDSSGMEIQMNPLPPVLILPWPFGDALDNIESIVDKSYLANMQKVVSTAWTSGLVTRQ